MALIELPTCGNRSSYFRSVQKALIPLFKALNPRTFAEFSGKGDSLSVQALNCMTERRAVGFFKYVGTHMDDVIRSYADKKSVECSMMQSTKR